MLGIQALECAPVLPLRAADVIAQRIDRYRAMLEAAFLVRGHVQPGDRLDSTPDDLPFQRVERRDVVAGQRREWNRLGDLNHVWTRIGTEPAESTFRRW